MAHSPRIHEAFSEHFGRAPVVDVLAPGRVNLIGEHTDYNEGFVLPACVDLTIRLLAGPNHLGTLRTAALRAGSQRDEIPLDDLRPASAEGWARYVRGMAALVAEQVPSIRGVDLLFDGDLPVGAGLSSSAALEIGVGLALSALWDVPLDRHSLARLGQRVENEFVGVQSGIMDQLVIGRGREDKALLIDCRTLTAEEVPLPRQLRLVVLDSGISRSLARSSYNERRRQCEEAVEVLRSAAPHIRSLRDASLDLLEREAGRLSPLLLRRARHVITENRRVHEARRALMDGRLDELGRLMSASHASLRDDFEVSTEELDTLVEIAGRQPGVVGARLTGAGFGGSVLALADADRAEVVAAQSVTEYRVAVGRVGRSFVCRAGPGARVRIFR